jgi:hypothetical protein
MGYSLENMVALEEKMSTWINSWMIVELMRMMILYSEQEKDCRGKPCHLRRKQCWAPASDFSEQTSSELFSLVFH